MKHDPNIKIDNNQDHSEKRGYLMLQNEHLKTALDEISKKIEGSVIFKGNRLIQPNNEFNNIKSPGLLGK